MSALPNLYVEINKWFPNLFYLSMRCCGEGWHEEVNVRQELPQLNPNLLHVLQVALRLLELDSLRQVHDSAHHAGRGVVHKVVGAVERSRRCRLDFLRTFQNLNQNFRSHFII